MRAYDPVAEERGARADPGRRVSRDALEPSTGADAVVIVTEWPEFAELDSGEVAERMARPVIVDGRNAARRRSGARPPASMYEGIGRR